MEGKILERLERRGMARKVLEGKREREKWRSTVEVEVETKTWKAEIADPEASSEEGTEPKKKVPDP